MYCKRCGNLLNENEKFCSKCGQKTSDNTNNNEGKKKSGALALIIVLIVLAIFIGSGILIVFKVKSFIVSNTNTSEIKNIINDTFNDIEEDIKDNIKDDSKTIEFDDYKVTKLSGYEYNATSSSLTISNSSFSCLVTVIPTSGGSLKTLIENKNIIEDTFKKSGMDVISIDEEKYNNNYLVINVSYLSQNMTTFYTQLDDDSDNYLYGVITFKKDKDESIMKEIDKIFNNIKYIEK